MSQISFTVPLDSSKSFVRTVALIAIASVLLLSPLSPLLGPASSDPGYVDNGDDTRSYLWNFTDPADYVLSNTTISDGTGMLTLINETIVENSTAQYLLGAGTNVDFQVVPDSMVINNTTLAVQTLPLQPGPEGIDTYIDEWFPPWNADTVDLSLNGELGKRSRIVMQFDLSAVPAGATIIDATLFLYEKPSKPDTIQYSIHALNDTWGEQAVSWNSGWGGGVVGGAFSTESFSNGTVDGDLGWHVFDLTRLVDLWTRGVEPNHGFIIVPRDEIFDGTKDFACSDVTNKPEQRPMLVVNYTLGAVVGIYESMPLGPGTNATFTLANWTGGIISKATDEFNSDNIPSRWEWMNDPLLSGGGYNFDTPGWLNITGTPSTSLSNTSVTCNMLYQWIAGNFSASTCVQERFSADAMGAGLLVYGDTLSWLALVKSGYGTNGSIMAIVCEGSASRVLTSVYWGDSDTAHLRIDRDSTSFQMYASVDGQDWVLVTAYDPPHGIIDRPRVGLCVYSGGVPSVPIAEFDYLRILPDVQVPELEMRVRTGNSTLLTDPSWSSWSSPIGPSSGASVGQTGMYIQYQATLSTSWSWLSPVFSGLTCYDKRHLQSGVIMTFEVNPVDLQVWQSMEVTQTTENGSIEYLYSTDQGGSWTSLGFGTSFPLAVTTSSFTVQAVLCTYDTLTSPVIDTIELTYAVAVSWFYISAPATVTAGVHFTMNVEARDPSDNIATSWDGVIALHALDATGTGPAAVEVHTTTAMVTDGTCTISDQEYDVAETIRISVNAGGAWGQSDTIVVQPGSVATITLEPGDDTMLEHTSLAFTATAFDSVGNIVSAAEFTWTAQESLGMLNSATGSVILLTVGDYDTGGYLSVSSGGVTTSRMIQVIPSRLAPTFDEALPDQVRSEDYGEWTLDITSYVSDAEDLDSMLRWYATNESVIDVRGENRTGNLIVTFSTIENAFGTNILNLFVVDSDGMRTSAPLSVEIVSVNDAPTIGHIDPIVVHYEVAYIFDFSYYVDDPDDAPEDLNLTVDDASSPYTSVSGFFARFNFPQSMMGTNHTVVVIVTDPGDPVPLSATAQVVIRITDDYVPTQLYELPSLVLNQSETLADCVYLPDYFHDPEGDVLYYASGYAHVSVEIKPNHYVNVSAPDDWSGVEYVIIQATDPDGARVEAILQVTVLWVNQPPSIENVPDLMVKHDDRYEFDIYPYVYDADDTVEDLVLSADDPHCTFMGSVMVVLYPMAKINTVNPVEITVTERNLSDSCMINITVSDNNPPRARSSPPLPDHSFQEDLPMQYPITQGLDYYFTDDEDVQVADFEAFALSPDVNASAFKTESNVWKVGFTTTPNYFGTCDLVLRGVDSEGAIAEEMVTLTILPIADAPSLYLPDSFEVTEGQQMILNLKEYVSDPDSFFENGDFTFEFRIVSVLTGTQDYVACISLLPGALVLQYPTGFLNDHVGEIVIEVSVTDESAKIARDEISILIEEAPTVAQENPWLWMAVVLAIAGGVSGMGAVAWIRRKDPFVVRDLMLIHNDGFLISRHAHHHQGEIDEDIMTGMLTAVLGFVEDSMNSQHDDLKSFGFKDYRVIVERGERCFLAVVFEGDAPDNIADPLKELLDTVEKVYKKKLANWTGDIETDFAGVELLLNAWVKDNSKGRSHKEDTVWKAAEIPKVEPHQEEVVPKVEAPPIMTSPEIQTVRMTVEPTIAEPPKVEPLQTVVEPPSTRAAEPEPAPKTETVETKKKSVKPKKVQVDMISGTRVGDEK